MEEIRQGKKAAIRLTNVFMQIQRIWGLLYSHWRALESISHCELTQDKF